MAALKRSAKSGNQWTQNDLIAYNISVTYQKPNTFFDLNMSILPKSQAPQEVSNTLLAKNMIDDDNFLFVHYIDLATTPIRPQVSAVVDFVGQLFRIIGYTVTNRDRIQRTHREIPLLICGEHKHVQTAVCLMNMHDKFLLLVQEEKRHMGLADAEPQLIAAAIAAVQSYNDNLMRRYGRPPLDAVTVAGIIMRGTAPTFYKIPLTGELIRCVQLGKYPETPVVVSACLPPISQPSRRHIDGMKSLENRRVILDCFEAFKQFL